jgi:mono/diheme cytochrome c family protein
LYPLTFWRLKAVLLCMLALSVTGWLAESVEGAPARPWLAPQRAKMVKNPVQATPNALAEAKSVFLVNCAGCHGENGDGNGPASVVLPRKAANFADAEMMAMMTDGELFWKMSTGRAPMPAWQDLLPVRQRWELVNYVRTFANAQPAVLARSDIAPSQETALSTDLPASGPKRDHPGLVEYWSIVRRHTGFVVLGTFLGGVVVFLLKLAGGSAFKSASR